jgi:hypothetical protein
MVLSLVMVDFVDWYGCVHHMWLNGLFLNHWLDGLVDVVVNMFASDCRHSR